MTGSGDIAPAVAGPGGNTIERGLVGVFAGLVVMLVVSTSFVTAEFRRGLIRTTFIASPRRGRVLAAKAVVLGTVTFVVGLVSALIAVVVITQLRRSAGRDRHPGFVAHRSSGGRRDRRAAGSCRRVRPGRRDHPAAERRLADRHHPADRAAVSARGRVRAACRSRRSGCCGSPRPPVSRSPKARRSTHRSTPPICRRSGSSRWHPGPALRCSASGRHWLSAWRMSHFSGGTREIRAARGMDQAPHCPGDRMAAAGGGGADGRTELVGHVQRCISRPGNCRIR